MGLLVSLGCSVFIYILFKKNVKLWAPGTSKREEMLSWYQFFQWLPPLRLYGEVFYYIVWVYKVVSVTSPTAHIFIGSLIFWHLTEPNKCRFLLLWSTEYERAKGRTIIVLYSNIGKWSERIPISWKTHRKFRKILCGFSLDSNTLHLG